MAWHNYAGTDTGEEIGRPFQGRIFFWEENSYGGAINTSTVSQKNVTKSVSSVVEVARIESGDITKYYRGIDSIYISKATSANSDYTFHLEYLLMKDDRLLDLLVNRSGGTVRSLGFALGANKDMARSSYYKLFGSKCKNVEISGSEGEMWKVSADFSVSSIHTASSLGSFGVSAPVGDHLSSGNLCPFNSTESAIDDGALTFAYVTKNFSVTVNHNLQDLWSVGSRNKKNCIEGALDVTGSCDISLDDGGRYHFEDVIDGACEPNIRINSAATEGWTSEPKQINLTNARFDSSSIDISPGSEGMMESAPFTAEKISVSSV